MNSRAVVKNIIINKKSIDTIVIKYSMCDSIKHFISSGQKMLTPIMLIIYIIFF